MTISRAVRLISRLFACSNVYYQFLYHVVRKVENKTKISNYGTSWFNPRGQKGWICTRDNITMARRGQNGWICPREPIVVSERGGFAHVGWNAPYNCRLQCRHNCPHCWHQRVTSAICHIGSQAAAADVAGTRPRGIL